MPHPLPRTSRRTALGGTIAGALGVAGCAVGPGAGDEPAAPVTTSFGSLGSDGPTAAPGPDQEEADPDVALVAVVLRQLDTAHQVVRANRRANPGLRTRLRPLERLHAAHAAALGAPPTTTAPAPAANGTTAALKRVATAERQLERRLVRAAVEAQSGALAQLLAAMAAAVTQVRATL